MPSAEDHSAKAMQPFASGTAAASAPVAASAPCGGCAAARRRACSWCRCRRPSWKRAISPTGTGVTTTRYSFGRVVVDCTSLGLTLTSVRSFVITRTDVSPFSGRHEASPCASSARTPRHLQDSLDARLHLRSVKMTTQMDWMHYARFSKCAARAPSFPNLAASPSPASLRAGTTPTTWPKSRTYPFPSR